VTALQRSPRKVFEEARIDHDAMVDISGSESFGSNLKNIVTEIAAGFSATQNNDKIGLILFSDQIELYIPPKAGHMSCILSIN
jgi:hypothetical protein